MNVRKFWENRNDTNIKYYDSLFYPTVATSSCPSLLALTEILKSWIMGISPDTPLYHYMSYDYFVAMLKGKCLRLEQAQPYSPKDEDQIFPALIKCGSTFASLAQQKNTVYIKCFSLERNSEKLWDKAAGGICGQDCICFQTTPVKLLAAVAAKLKRRMLAYSVLKVTYRTWNEIVAEKHTPLLTDANEMTIRRYESLSTLPSEDNNGEKTTYTEEKEVRFVYEKLRREFKKSYLRHPLRDFSFITEVRLSCSENGRNFNVLKDELQNVFRLNCTIALR